MERAHEHRKRTHTRLRQHNTHTHTRFGMPCHPGSNRKKRDQQHCDAHTDIYDGAQLPWAPLRVSAKSALDKHMLCEKEDSLRAPPVVNTSARLRRRLMCLINRTLCSVALVCHSTTSGWPRSGDTNPTQAATPRYHQIWPTAVLCCTSVNTANACLATKIALAAKRAHDYSSCFELKNLCLPQQ